jgi:hypothetical protein
MAMCCPQWWQLNLMSIEAFDFLALLAPQRVPVSASVPAFSSLLAGIFSS